MKELHVKSLLPVRLDKYLMEQFPALGIGRLNKALRENKIKLNGKKQPLSTRVQNGDVIRLFLADDQLEKRPLPPAVFVYKDNDVLVVNKPAGVEVDGPAADTLLKRVQATLAAQGEAPQAVLCHRLDAGTSGLILLARNGEAERFLTDAIKKRLIQKRYLCVTFGRPQPPAALLHDYLLKDAQRGVVRILPDPAPGAKEVLTGYETLAVSGRLALLQVELITGRTHQIRAHFASIGHPLAGDGKYGKNAVNKGTGFPYQALYSYKLRFDFQTDAGPLQYLDGREFTAGEVWFLPEFYAMPQKSGR